jgi:hypothetical protein
MRQSQFLQLRIGGSAGLSESSFALNGSNRGCQLYPMDQINERLTLYLARKNSIYFLLGFVALNLRQILI